MDSTGSERDGWTRLAHAVRDRRQALQLSHSGVARQGGPSHETVRLVERGPSDERSSFRELTVTQLDRGLRWKPGTARAIVAGTAPADPREWEAEVTPEDRERLTPARRGRPDPEGMAPLPLSLDNVSDMELAGEMVRRLTRGVGPDAERRRIELLLRTAMTAVGEAGEDSHPRAS